MVRPFKFEAPQEQLDDLSARLATTRLPPPAERADWALGTPAAYLREVVDYWRSGFSWRAVEQRLARLPHYIATIGEHEVHFLHVRGTGANPYPLILTHGWPSSFLEFLSLVPLLTEAVPDGAPPLSFDLVIPSLPGYGFSRGPLGSYTEVAELWVELMRDQLGYRRFGAHGGDIGAGVTSRMGLYHPDSVEAIHVLSAPPFVAGEGALSAEEERYLAYGRWWDEQEGAYAHLQRTRPFTLGAALEDSPAGLAAWLLEKWHGWSDGRYDVEKRLGRDFLLANVTLYWLTSTITSSMEMYWHNRNRPRAAWPDKKVAVPARLFLTTEPVDLVPESAARRVYADLSYGLALEGGHFLAAEQPELLAADLRQFFRPFAQRL